MIWRVLLVVVVALACGAPCAAEVDPPARVLVMPFENVKRDGRLFWLGEASAILLADNLNALGANAITREERRQAFERLRVPPAATLTAATMIRIGQLVGAERVILGSLELDNETFVVHARAIALQSGRLDVDVVDRGPMADLFATFEGWRDRSPLLRPLRPYTSRVGVRRSRRLKTTSRDFLPRRRRPPSAI